MTETPLALSREFADYTPGDVIAKKYRLERLLGEGAQGSVWLAENLSLGARVAIKLVHAEPADPTPVLRLEKEARAAARIAHSSVVRVFDLGRTANGDTFIVMEFLEGDNLADRLAACGRLPAMVAVRTLLPIADVLHVAHERGIVHRDLKPANVFLSRSGEAIQPKLLDFGIAKLHEAGANEPVITEVGMMVGSPAYAAPEQAACWTDVGKEADIWAFCVVLYECLTGTVPFETEECPELFRQIREDAPRSILAHGVGELELWEIIRRGLSKSPAERWPTMHALGQALAAWLSARGVQDDISGVVLASKWLGRGHAAPGLAPDAFEPPSFVRRIEDERTLGAWRVTEPAPRPPGRARTVALATAIVALATAGLAAVPWRTEPPETEAASPPAISPTPTVAPSPPLQTLAATPATPTFATTGSALLPLPPAPEPEPRAERPERSLPDGGVPAKRRVRREPNSELLNPY